MMAGWRNRTYADLMNVRYEAAVKRIVQMLQAGVDRGELRPLVPMDTISRMFLTLHDGIMVEATQFGAERARTAEQIGAFKQAFGRLLGVREEGASE